MIPSPSPAKAPPQPAQTQPEVPIPPMPEGLSGARRPRPRAQLRAPASPRRRAYLRATRIVMALAAVLAVVAAFTLLPYGYQLRAAQYQRPWTLIALLLAPVLLWRCTYGEDRRTVRLRVGTVAAMATGPRGWRVALRDLPGVLRAVGFALLVLALARPVDTTRPEIAEESGIDVMLALDLSGSMAAVMENVPDNLKPHVTVPEPGIPPRRVDIAKAVVRDFISRRKSDRIGVIVFGKSAFVLSPQTLDYQLLDQLVSKMDLRIIDESGTAIGDALGAAVARLRHSSAKSKAVILLTDGENNSGAIAPLYAAELAAKVGAKVYTIQIGDGSVARVYVGRTLLGQPRFDEQNFPINPELLRQLAEKTAGTMYVASDAKGLQDSFHDVLDKLEKSRFEAGIARFEELFPILLLPGVLLLAVEAFLRAFVLRRFP
jgi:Ca-activated chloride channel homolog